MFLDLFRIKIYTQETKNEHGEKIKNLQGSTRTDLEKNETLKGIKSRRSRYIIKKNIEEVGDVIIGDALVRLFKY